MAAGLKFYQQGVGAQSCGIHQRCAQPARLPLRLRRDFIAIAVNRHIACIQPMAVQVQPGQFGEGLRAINQHGQLNRQRGGRGVLPIQVYLIQAILRRKDIKRHALPGVDLPVKLKAKRFPFIQWRGVVCHHLPVCWRAHGFKHHPAFRLRGWKQCRHQADTQQDENQLAYHQSAHGAVVRLPHRAAPSADCAVKHSVH